MQEPLQLKRMQKRILGRARLVRPNHRPIVHQEPEEADGFATGRAVHTTEHDATSTARARKKTTYPTQRCTKGDTLARIGFYALRNLFVASAVV